MTKCQSDNVISDTPITPIFKYSQVIKDKNAIPSLVWLQQMEKDCIKTYNVVHNDRPDRCYETDYTKDFETQVRPLRTVEDSNPHSDDPEYGADSFWDKTLNVKENLQFRCVDYSLTDDEANPLIEDNKLSRAVN